MSLDANEYSAAEAGIEAVDLSMEVHGGSGFTGEVDISRCGPWFACCAPRRSLGK